jgi:hypothetical protein
MGVSFCHIAAIQLPVIRAVRAYLLAEGDMKVEPECVDMLELVLKFLARGSPPCEENLTLAGEGLEEEFSDKVFHRLNHSTRVSKCLAGRARSQ